MRAQVSEINEFVGAWFLRRETARGEAAPARRSGCGADDGQPAPLLRNQPAPDAGAFTEGRLEHLTSGRDRRQVANRFTAEDLVAVQTLSITVPAPAALDLLEGSLDTQLSELKRESPGIAAWCRDEPGGLLFERGVPCVPLGSVPVGILLCEVALLPDFEWLFTVAWKLAHSGSS
ncbi:DUF6308 family protein [Streptomyces sp. NBC_00233]|uniref:DUF6308 family protein n=1 Tax=Streptomyces sp. NBC_00233 TaxID=2975686 RepID=UPI00338EF1E0